MLEEKVELNGEEYILTYDWDAQIKAEEMTGINLLAPSNASQSAVIRAYFLARLLKNHPEMTLDKLSALMPMNMEKISTALGYFIEP